MARRTPTELLFQQTKGFFNLLPPAVLLLHLRTRQFSRVGDEVAASVFDDQHFVLHLAQPTAGTPEAVRPFLFDGHTLQQAIALQASHILPTLSFQQVEETASGIPTIKQHISWAQSTPLCLAQQLLG